MTGNWLIYNFSIPGDSRGGFYIPPSKRLILNNDNTKVCKYLYLQIRNGGSSHFLGSTIGLLPVETT